jgi:hypothetical protein
MRLSCATRGSACALPRPGYRGEVKTPAKGIIMEDGSSAARVAYDLMHAIIQEERASGSKSYTREDMLNLFQVCRKVAGGDQRPI